jgi:hypothetical protein
MTFRTTAFTLLTSALVSACAAHATDDRARTAASLDGPTASPNARERAAKTTANDEASLAAPGTAALPAEGAGRASRSESAPLPVAPEAEARPGLGTSWGESIESRVSTTTFVRADGDRPFATAAFFYNDDDGVSAMTRGRFVEWDESVISFGSGIAVSVVDASGRPLPAAHVDGRTYAVGSDGERYVIRVENRTPARLEAVATVDGLDVIDGDDGDPKKRGYVVAPYDTLEIEGFRDGEGSVRAFRFGATDDAYASRRGKGRNVGVIGVALFHEPGERFRWTPDEVRVREGADPFPGRFAPPPPNVWRAN